MTSNLIKETITGSGVCERTNDFYDYLCGFDPQALSRSAPSFITDYVAGWPREFFRNRYGPSEVIVPKE